MKVLIACEESQEVCKAFRALGHEAYSCDTQPCSGGHPEWHIQDDVLKHLDDSWDLMVAHPPCTYLSHAGARWLHPGGKLNKQRYDKGMIAKQFFMKLLNAPIERICVENPLPSKIYDLPKHTQIVHPYYFGDSFQKRTLLWLKNLLKLESTKIVDKGEMIRYKSGLKAKWILDNKDSRVRSKTFPGIAKAMAMQWGI